MDHQTHSVPAPAPNGEVPSDDLDPVAALAEEFLQRRRAGERLTVADYVDRYPALAGRIRAVFPALLAVADLEPRTTDRTGDVVPARAGDRSPPERIGDYRILREVGRGGMGIVYEAEQESLGRHVALKVLPGHSLLDTARLERFRREAKAAARLHHTNIVPVFGVGEEGGLHYYAMQFIQGQGLDQVLEELRRLRRGGQEGTGESSVHLPGQDPSSSLSEKGLAFWRGVARVGVQVAEALAHAHAQGILHRDVKPSNLLLDTHGTVWVTDFGLAKWEGDSDQLTHTGDIVGTMRYMAPERFDGRADPRSDVCSLGLALYELLTLRPAFDETDRNKLLRQVLHEGPPAPRSLDPTIPRDLETIVLAAIARDPADRYQSAQKMADDLTRFLEDRPLAARRANRAEQFRRWCRRNPALALLTGAVTGLLLVGLVSATLTALHLGRVAEREQGLKVEALVAKGEAEEKAREARQRLAQQYLTHGEGATGSVEGLAWMAEALDLDGDDPGRAATYRLRLRTLMGEAPRPIRAWRKPGVRLPPRPMTHYRHPLAGPDGRFVLLLDSNGQARVWDMEAIRPLGPGPLAGTAVRYGVFTADGKRACTVDTAGTVRVHDTATARPIGSPLLHERGLVLARFSPDGRRLLTWSLRDSLVDDVGLVARLWQVGTGAAPLLLRHPGGVFVADFSPDGRLVVTAGGRTAQLWDAQTGEARGAAMQHRLGVQHAGFTPDGQSLLTTDASAGGASLISTWRVPTGQSLGPVGAPSRHVAVSPDGRLAVGASYNSVGIVDLATRALLCTPPHPQFVFAAHFSQDGTRVLTISEDRAVRVWDPLSGKPLGQPLWHGTAPQHAFFLADGATIRTITEDGMVRDWQLPQGTPTSAFTKGPTGAFTGEGKAVRLAFSKDGRYVAAGTFEATPSVWERASGKRVAQVHHPHWPWHVALSPDGRHLATGGWDGVARVWDVKSGRQVGPDLVHRPRIASLAFSPDGARLLTGATGFPGGARVWDFRSGRAVPGLLPGGRSVSHVEYSPDGARLLTVGSDGARLWDARTGAALPSPTQVEQGQHGNFSPNGLLVVTAHGSTAHVWDTATGQAVGQPLRHAGRVQCVEFSADGSRIATASADQTARIWEARTGRPITPPLRHPANVAEAHFSPDGRYLATASSEGGRIWDTVHGHLLARFPHEGWPGRARFSPDGRQFFLYDLDDQVRFWDWPPPDDGRPSSDLVQQARLLAGHRVDARTGLAPLTGEEFQSAFDALKAKYPADFAPLPPLDRVAWHRRAAQACIRAGNNKAAVLHLDRLLERDGKAAGDWLARSRVHSALGDWKQAGKDAAKAIALGDDSAEAWYLDGRAHHHMRKHKEAVPKLTRAIERDPTLIHAWELRGQARTDLGLWAEGVADNTKAIDLGTKNDWTWYHRGQGRAGLGQLEEAHADMTRSLAGRPKELWWAWDGRGQVAARLGRWQEAAADFARATTDSRASVALWYHLALARLRQGDRDGYRSVCAAAVERFGKDGSDGTRQGLVWMCVVAPDALADRARPLEVLGGKVGPRLPAGRVDLLVLGAALYRAGRFDAATKVLDLAGKARGKGGTAWEELFLALACARRGQAGEARRHLERAKEWIAQAEAGKLTTGRYLWTDRAALGLLQREAEAQLR